MDRVEKLRAKQRAKFPGVLVGTPGALTDQPKCPRCNGTGCDAGRPKHPASCQCCPGCVPSVTGQTKPAPPGVPGKAPGVPQNATEPAKPPKSHVQYRCGHREPVACLESGNCPGCANKARKARGKRRKWAEDDGRLPDGSTFNVAYDERTETWSGILLIPGMLGMGTKFHGTASGVEALLRRLAGQHRESLRGKGSC